MYWTPFATTAFASNEPHAAFFVTQ
jgi:hypothetical protein